MLAPVIAGVLVFCLVAPAVKAWRLGSDVRISTGSLVGAACMAVGVMVLVRWAAVLLRSGLTFAVLIGVVLAASVAGPILWRGVLFTVPVWLVAVVVVGSLAFSVWGLRRQAAAPDVVADPVTGLDVEAATRAAKGHADPALAAKAAPWIMPAICVVWALAVGVLPL